MNPDTRFAAAAGIETDRGILVDREFSTSRKGVYAIGDCAQFRDPLPDGRTIEQLWYSGRRHGQFLAHNLTGRRLAYDPGIYFNSAKFFELEYQVYGRVDAGVGAGSAVGQDSVVLADDHRNRMVRIQYDAASRAVAGVNSVGVRLRHETWDSWIREGLDVHHALARFKESLFDPEFFRGLRIPELDTGGMA